MTSDMYLFRFPNCLLSHYDDLLSVYIAIKKCQYFQAAIGISANIFLLLVHIFRLLLNNRPKPTDLIICHLAFIHIMKLFAALFLLSPDLFESLNFQDSIKCKALFFMGRVARSLSICITCLLSVLQAVTICPSTALFVHFKFKSTAFTYQFFLFSWFISLSLSSNLILYTVASSNVTQTSVLSVDRYCSLSPMNALTRNFFFILTSARDVFFVGMMLLSSLYIMLFLIRHQRRCQHLHKASFSLRVSPEKRAVQSILLLVSFFVLLSWVDFLISSTLTLLWTCGPIVMCVHSFVVNFYAAVSPLVLINSDPRIVDLVQKVWQNCHQLFMTSLLK